MKNNLNRRSPGLPHEYESTQMNSQSMSQAPRPGTAGGSSYAIPSSSSQQPRLVQGLTSQAPIPSVQPDSMMPDAAGSSSTQQQAQQPKGGRSNSPRNAGQPSAEETELRQPFNVASQPPPSAQNFYASTQSSQPPSYNPTSSRTPNQYSSLPGQTNQYNSHQPPYHMQQMQQQQQSTASH